MLVATKQLLEMLTQWSRKTASEGEVSDIYVRLGYEFNLACRAFGAIGVDTSDLGPVPDLLRSILEDTLSQEASPQSLDRFLPRIRDIIINLLHGLKKKQAKLRSRQTKDGSRSAQGRHPSGSSIGASETGLTQMLEDTPSSALQSSPKRPPGRRYGSNTSIGDDQTVVNAPMSPQGGSFSEREASKREAQRTANTSASASLSSATMQNIPVLTPNVENQSASPGASPPPSQPTPSQYPRPPPTPKANDALGALQRSGDLERRASRRFSAYQIQKHLGASSNGVPVLPSQNSPIPNRGGDVRESMNAVRLRGSYLHSRQRSTNRFPDSSPNRGVQPPQRIAEEKNEAERQPEAEKSSFDHSDNESAATTTPAENLRQPDEPDSRDIPVMGGTLPGLPPITDSGSLAESFKGDGVEQRPSSDDTATPQPASQDKDTTAAVSTPPQSQQFTPEQSPPPGKELTLFLQYKSKIKKFVLSEGYADLTIGRLQLAFIEKFAWNTHNNGVDLPEIYVQDPVSGVRHELENLNDVKDRSVLVLNVEPLDEVKKHMDEGLDGIRRMIEGVRTVVTDQETAIQRVSERQLEAAKDMALLTAAPTKSTAATSEPSKAPAPLAVGSGSRNTDHLFELQNLRRDLAVLRQTYSSFTSDIATSMNTIRTKAGSVKSAAVDVSIPTFEGDAGRARVNSGKKDLAEESEKLVARVDDLQDLVEDLRKDVVTRGVRPLPRQLEGVGRDISLVTKELKKMQDFLKKEKPIWTKIWEAELQLVCEERDQLTMQEDLACDLEDDLEKAAQTFALVEQATKQQNQNAQNPTTAGPGVLRNVSRNVVVEPVLDPLKAKDGVLGEVRALQPNHENRLEAIERAEKTRQKELETRRVGAFQRELGNFVGEGKLKKSGGVEEAERLRKTRDERARKDAWEFQQARAAEMERLEREADEADAAAAAAAAAEAEEEPEPGDVNGVDSSPVPEDGEKPKEENPETPGM